MATPEHLGAALRELARFHGVTVADLLAHWPPSDPLTFESHRALRVLDQYPDPDLYLKLLNPGAPLVLGIMRLWP